jgi:hypothetical protein
MVMNEHECENKVYCKHVQWMIVNDYYERAEIKL